MTGFGAIPQKTCMEPLIVLVFARLKGVFAGTSLHTVRSYHNALFPWLAHVLYGVPVIWFVNCG
jgi:hypothetical protein